MTETKQRWKVGDEAIWDDERVALATDPIQGIREWYAAVRRKDKGVAFVNINELRPIPPKPTPPDPLCSRCGEPRSRHFKVAWRMGYLPVCPTATFQEKGATDGK